MSLIRRPFLGLALGGGGARGLAHIGVLKAFERHNIPIDCLAGSSMGGILTAAYAAGNSAADLEAVAMRFSQLSNLFRLLDLALPRDSLIEGHRIRTYLSHLIPETLTFADLEIPAALTAVDLLTGAEHILREGSVLQAVLATAAFPGLFPPVRSGDALLIDGGVLNNVPADVTRALGAEVVVAVNVVPQFPRQHSPEETESPHILPHFLPRSLDYIYQAEMIMTEGLTAARLRKARPELILRPSIPFDVSVFLGFTHAAETIAAGEQAALQALPQLENLLRPRFRLPNPRLD